LDPVKYTSTKPTVLLHNENDRLVWPGQTSAYVAERNAKIAPALASYESALSAYESAVTARAKKIATATSAVTKAKTAAAKKKAKAALASAKAKAAPVEPVMPSANVVALYAMAPVEYTKYSATGLPDLADVGASSGVGHEQFTSAQVIAFAEMLDAAAVSGKLNITPESFEIFGAAFGINGDLDYLPIPLKY
jgi:hypothetical protein